jgi:hypothetical protein
MASQNKREISDGELDALLEKAVGAREQKEWEEKVRKVGGALGDAAGIYVWEGAATLGGPSECSALCHTPNPPTPYNLNPLKPGRFIEIHPGDHVPSNPQWRKVTAVEAAPAVTIGDVLRLREPLKVHAAAKETRAGILREVARTEELIAELKGRLRELATEEAKAAAQIGAAREPVERFLEGWPTQRRRVAIGLANEFSQEQAENRGFGQAPAQVFQYDDPAEIPKEEASGER